MNAVNLKYNLCITCLKDNMYAPNFQVFIIDSNNEMVYSKKTNNRGRAYFLIKCAGNYKIKVVSDKLYSPYKSNRWVKINPNCLCNQHFLFRRISNIKLAKLKIILADKFYPEYRLEQGEYKLWLKY